jgi:phage terminase large subunit-like protein
MAGNVELYKGKNNPNDNMRPVKPEGDRSRNKRIDGIVAAIMALSDFMDGATGRRKPSAFNDPKRKLFI